MLLLLLAGCLNNGIEWSELSFTRTKPSDQDVVGVWKPTSATLRDMHDAGGYPDAQHELILSADGSFSMVNMPDWWSDEFGRSHKKFESRQGKWRITKASDVFTIYVIELADPSGSMDLNLSRQKAPYLIHITLGDPDSGHYMLFERDRTPSAHDIRLNPAATGVTALAEQGPRPSGRGLAAR